jgi:hypothetical protein
MLEAIPEEPSQAGAREGGEEIHFVAIEQFILRLSLLIFCRSELL